MAARDFSPLPDQGHAAAAAQEFTAEILKGTGSGSSLAVALGGDASFWDARLQRKRWVVGTRSAASKTATLPRFR